MNPYLLINIKQKYWWPTPTDFKPTLRIMRKLVHRSQVICALEAAKMVLPMWEQWEQYTSSKSILNKEQKEAPRKAIQTVEKWLEGKATKEELEKVATAAGNSSYNTRAVVTANAVYAGNAASATSWAASTAGSADYAPANAANTVYAAANANTTDDDLEFYDEWWGRCYPLIQQELQNKYDLLYGSDI